MKQPKLSGLSKQEKVQLLLALEEKERRALERRSPYTPNEGQQKVHLSKALERYCFAGNGSGKTAMLVNEVYWAATGFNPITQEHTYVPAKVIVVLDSPEKIGQVFLPELRKWHPIKEDQLHKRGKPYVSEITLANGSVINFIMHDQDEMKAESIQWHYLFFDEPCTRKLYVALKRGGRSKEMLGRILFIGTPIAAPWLRTDVYEPWARGERPNTECFRFSTYVNQKNLADGYIADYESVLSDKEKRTRLEGDFFDTDGLALAHLFSRSTHTLPVSVRDRWPSSWPCVVAVDPHPRRSHVAVLLGVTPQDDLVALKELTSRSVPSEFARELRAWTNGFRVVDWVCDSLGSSELTGGDGNLSFISVLNKNGIRIRSTSFKEKSDEAWISMIHECLAIPLEPDNMGRREPRLKVIEDLKLLISDIENVSWKRYKNIDEVKPALDISNKDALAALKYCLATQPRFTKGKEKVVRLRKAPPSTSRFGTLRSNKNEEGWDEF